MTKCGPFRGVVTSNNPPFHLLLVIILNKWGPLVKNPKKSIRICFPFQIKLSIINLEKSLRKNLKKHLSL